MEELRGLSHKKKQNKKVRNRRNRKEGEGLEYTRGWRGMDKDEIGRVKKGEARRRTKKG